MRSGNELPPLQPLQENNITLKCTKCHMGYYQRSEPGAGGAFKNADKIFEQLENENNDLTNHIQFYEKKV